MTWTLKDKTCVVTGGNSGIGLATAVGLAREGARAIVVSRDRGRGEAAVARARDEHGVELELIQGDLGTVADARALAGVLRERCPELHVLVNNAGLWMSRRVENADGLETTFAVNHMGPFVLTNLLLERLIASAPARVVNVASTAHRQGKLDFDDLRAARRFGRIKAYADSKLCNVLFTRELARRLEGTGVTTNALHPGVVDTNIAQHWPRPLRWVAERVGPWFLATPEQGARTSIHLAAAPELEEVSGRYFQRSREVTPSKRARSDADARRLWEVSERLAGLGTTAARAAVPAGRG